MAIFEKYPAAKWSVDGSGIDSFFPVTDIVEEGANRIVERERPYRDGAKLDDTGSKARVWRVEALFENSIEELGVGGSGGGANGKPLYPDVVNDIVRSFDRHETGDLVLPTVGKVRARAKSYSRTESGDMRDGCKMAMIFVEDNEDSIGARNFQPPTVKASIRALAEQTTFSAEADAVFDGSVGELNTAADQLEAIANFPGDTVQDIDAQAGIVVAATDRVGRAFTNSNPTEKARTQLTDPDSSVTQRKLLQLKDTSARAKKDLTPSGIARHVVKTTTDLFALAVELGFTAEELIALNPAHDPFLIKAGVVVQVPQDA